MISPIHSPRHRVCIPNFMKPSSLLSDQQSILKSDFHGDQPFNENFHVILYDKHIEIISKENGRFKIVYDFENKFSIEETYLSFHRENDSKLQLSFLKNEMQIWRRQLGKRLCQKFRNVPFRIKKRISVRNLCAIYLAQQDRLEKGKVDQLAVKAFRKTSLEVGKGYEDFKNQIRIMRVLKHPNICKLQYVYQSQNSYYICMSHYEGGTLLQRHGKDPYSFTSVKQIMKQILISLDYLHTKGIVHRDIKPQNILLQKSGSNQVIIIDFGLAVDTHQSSNLTLKCGTPGYVAPQIFKASNQNPYDDKCDIFSAGILFFWLLTKKLPYTAKTQQQLKIENYSFNFDSKRYSGLESVPFECINLLALMLKRNPKERISARQGLKHEFFEGMNENHCQSLKNSKYSSFDRQQIKFNY